MNQHVNVLGYLFLANGALALLAGVIVGLVLGGTAAASGDVEAAGVLAGVGGIVWIVLLIVAIPYFATGYGLLKRLSWGRIAGIVMGALSLLSFPLGTALGVYAIWALTRPEAEVEFA